MCNSFGAHFHVTHGAPDSRLLASPNEDRPVFVLHDADLSRLWMRAGQDDHPAAVQFSDVLHLLPDARQVIEPDLLCRSIAAQDRGQLRLMGTLAALLVITGQLEDIRHLGSSAVVSE